MQSYKDSPTLIKLLDQFKHLPFLQAFEELVLRQILNASRIVVYEPEELIISQGAFGDRLYVLLSGQVRVTQDRRLIATLDQVGEIFGELAMLGKPNRSASIYAVETTWCLELALSSLRQLPPAERDACHARLYRYIAGVIADRLIKTTQELTAGVQELEQTRRLPPE